MKEKPGFNHEIKMWVFEELVDGRKLTEIINETHENVKYLKGFSIPENVVSFLIWMMERIVLFAFTFP